MSKKPNFHYPTRITKSEFEWAIGFDKHLAAVLESEGVEESDAQMDVCNVLQRLGLAEHRMFNEKATKTFQHQEHYYAATKKMRKLL